MSERPRLTKVGLAMGAGGARGLAHIGAARAIREAGLDVTAIAGSSMGAIVGAMIAAGHDADAMEARLRDRSRFRMPSPGGRGGLFGHDKIIDVFCRDLPPRIESLPIPFVAVATDISSGDVVHLDRGPLGRSLAASAAIPGILTPVDIGGRQLVDGGIINGLPVDVIRELTEDPVLAIDVTPARDRALAFERSDPWWRRVWWRVTFQQRPLSVDVLLKAFAIQQSILTAERIRQHPPDLHVRVNLDPDVFLESFDRFEEVVEAGYRSTRRALEEHTLHPEVRPAQSDEASRTRNPT